MEEQRPPLTDKFQYLGVLNIAPALNKDLEIQERAKKAKAQMGALLTYFFMVARDLTDEQNAESTQQDLSICSYGDGNRGISGRAT